MATPKETIINKISIRADAQNSDSPKNADTQREISIKPHDDIDFAIALSNGDNPIAAAAISRINIEIYNIGARNAPSPRNAKLLFSKSSESISELTGTNTIHTNIALDAENNTFDTGAKWLRACAFSPSGKRTTFAQGWINIEESFGDSPNPETVISESFLKTDDAKGMFIQKENNFSDILDTSTARENLGVMSVAEIAAAIETACAEKADTNHSHSQYLTTADAQNIYASSAQTETSITSLNSRAASLETSSATMLASIKTLDSKSIDLQLSKASSDALCFNGGLLEVAKFANKSIGLPMSLAVTYDVADWAGLGTSGVSFFSNFTVYNTQRSLGFRFTYDQSTKQIAFNCANYDAEDTHPFGAEFSCYSTNSGVGLPTGRHTLVACVGATLTSGAPAFALFLDGVSLSCTNQSTFMTSTDITSTQLLQINRTRATSTPTEIQTRLSRAMILNFDMSETTAPYSVAEYASGKSIPSKLLPLAYTFNTDTYPIASYTLTKFAVGTADIGASVADDYLTVAVTQAGTGGSNFLGASLYAPRTIAKGSSIDISFDDFYSPPMWLHETVEGYGHLTIKVGGGVYVFKDGSKNIHIDYTTANSIQIELTMKQRFTDTSCDKSLAVGDVFWKVKGLKVRVNGAEIALDDCISGRQVRDKSGNNLHAEIYGNISADRYANPACGNYSLGWTSGQSNGVYCGGSSSVLALPANSFVKLLVKGDNATAANFKIGGSTSATQYSSAISVSSAGWTALEITTGATPSALYLTPSAALAAATNLTLILTATNIY